jgi:hypothetical protein
LSGFVELFARSLTDQQRDMFWEIVAEMAQREDVFGRSKNEMIQGIWKQLEIKLAII